MAGVRIRHPTAHSGIIVVAHYRRYRVPLVCPTCKKVHFQKHYHISIDENGFSVVSLEVLRRLKEVGMAGFEIVGEERNPPSITLDVPSPITNRFRVFEMGVPRKDG